MYNKIGKKTQEGISLAYESKAKAIQKINRLNKFIKLNEKFVFENLNRGKRDVAEAYCRTIAQTKRKIDYLQEECTLYDNVVVNLTMAEGDFDKNNLKNYKKISKITKKVISVKERQGPMDNQSKSNLENIIGNLNDLYDREGFVNKNLKSQYSSNDPEIQEEARQYLQNIEAKLQGHKKKHSDLEKAVSENSEEEVELD